MSRTVWAWARPGCAALTLDAVVWQLGTGPFRDGVRAFDGGALAAAAGIGGLTTVCCACAVDHRGTRARRPRVAAACRRDVLPVDVPQPDAPRRGRRRRSPRSQPRARRQRCGLRCVGRRPGSAPSDSSCRSSSPSSSSSRCRRPCGRPCRFALALVATVIGVALLHRVRPGRGPSRYARARTALAGDVRDAPQAWRAWPAIALASAVVVLGHAVTFLIAARTAGTNAPVSRLLPLALLAMAAMALPSVAGWGPREGATAWAFGAAGLGAEQGVATAVVYGVMVLVASLPGALVVSGALRPRRRPPRARESPLPGQAQVMARPDGAADA